MATDSRFDSILFGCILASYHNPAVDEPGRAGSLWKWVLLPIGVAVLLFSFVYRDPGFRDSLRYTLQGLALFPIFVVAIREPDWGPFRLLNLRWVKLAGALSYSLYLLHQVVLLGVEHRTQLSPVSAGLLALSISGFAAYAIHRLVELPCAKLRRRLAADEAGHQPVVEQRARRVVLVETARP
jgi:peptidoglycan/LPS O-acetylase OafA/YrhL